MSDTYFAFFIYFKGEEAARKHYGAWSPPVGTPNPNAAGATATPAPAPTAPAPAQATEAQIAQAQAQTTDSSVRKVSNLPAWMTKQ